MNPNTPNLKFFVPITYELWIAREDSDFLVNDTQFKGKRVIHRHLGEKSGIVDFYWFHIGYITPTSVWLDPTHDRLTPKHPLPIQGKRLLAYAKKMNLQRII